VGVWIGLECNHVLDLRRVPCADRRDRLLGTRPHELLDSPGFDEIEEEIDCRFDARASHIELRHVVEQDAIERSPPPAVPRPRRPARTHGETCDAAPSSRGLEPSESAPCRILRCGTDGHHTIIVPKAPGFVGGALIATPITCPANASTRITVSSGSSASHTGRVSASSFNKP